MEEEEGASEEVEGNPSCEKEKEKKNEENEKERENEEEEKEKEQANGKSEECESVFLLENLGYRGYREDVLKDRLRSPIDNLHTQKNADKTLFFTATTDTAYHTSILMCEKTL